MKKAQLTLMIITGIVFVIAIGMVIWLGGKGAQRRTATEAEQQRLRQVAVQPIKDYIQTCLDLVATKALELLGKQGLVLYKSQGGLTDDVFAQEVGQTHILFDEHNVRYNILPPAQNIDTRFYAQPPQYPFPTFPYIINATTGEVIKTVFDGYFGDLRFPPLLKPGQNSIQEQLESSITFNLPKCTNWESFRPQGLAVAAEAPNVTVLIAENVTQIATEQFFTVLVDWPVTVTDLTTNGNTSINEFSIGYPVHLAKFYLFVQKIMYDEVTNTSADPRNASTPATPVVVVENVYVHEDDSGDDLIVAQDAKSFLRGKPLEFRFLRKNRAPALFWINQSDLAKYRFIPMGTCKDKESIALSGKNLDITWAETAAGDATEWHAVLAAMDPDEDLLTFKTYPPSPIKIDVPYPGTSQFTFDVCVSDGSENEDCQRSLTLNTTGCPVEE